MRSPSPDAKERIRAARALSQSRDASVELQLKGKLYIAQIYGLTGSKKRRSAMKKARRFATRIGDRETMGLIKQAMNGDKALSRLTRHHWGKMKQIGQKESSKNRKRGRRGRASKDGEQAVSRELAQVKASLAAWQGLEDTPQWMAARFQLLASDALGAKNKKARKKVRKALGALVADAGEHRDIASTVVAAHRLAVALALKDRKYKQAALHSLAADRAVRPSSKRAWPGDTHNIHGRTKETLRLCKELKKRRIDCGQLEEDRWGTRSFWDFSKSKTRRFSQQKARLVLAEYDPLLKGCIDQSQQLTEFDTEVLYDWTVDPSGRVSQYTVRPRRLESGPFRECTDKAFDLFRYPRFRGPPASASYTIDIDLQDARLKP